MSDPANLPIGALVGPPAPKRTRSFLSKAKTAKEKTAHDDQQAREAIPIVVAELIDPANGLNSNDQSGSTHITQVGHPSPSVIKRARRLMIEKAEFFVLSHLEIIRKSLLLASDDPKYLETARRATEFALTHISEDGERIVDKPNANQPTTMPTINIGVALGGMPTMQRKQLTNGDD